MLLVKTRRQEAVETKSSIENQNSLPKIARIPNLSEKVSKNYKLKICSSLLVLDNSSSNNNSSSSFSSEIFEALKNLVNLIPAVDFDIYQPATPEFRPPKFAKIEYLK